MQLPRVLTRRFLVFKYFTTETTGHCPHWLLSCFKTDKDGKVPDISPSESLFSTQRGHKQTCKGQAVGATQEPGGNRISLEEWTLETDQEFRDGWGVVLEQSETVSALK